MTGELICFDDWTLEKAGPNAFIQWKGTDACMDFHCACGTVGHIDGEFLYYVKCNDCGAVYETECHVKLLRVTDPAKLEELEREDRAVGFGDAEATRS